MKSAEMSEALIASLTLIHVFALLCEGEQLSLDTVAMEKTPPLNGSSTLRTGNEPRKEKCI